MNRSGRALLTEATRPAWREIAARQAVCAALALAIFAVAVRIALVW
ncbi:hypothetical protein LPW26_04215 [Rhodopseudomonas sp. HC1]|nr:hypothetical protein [Rhodopseudomonas infernalis]MCG6203832.1 hypothetical protein [Rhodopseudomonas infernalis]